MAIPIDLLEREKEKVYESINGVGRRSTKIEAGSFGIRQRLELKESVTRERWTPKPSEVNYYLTQFLTARGCFNKHLAKILTVETGVLVPVLRTTPSIASSNVRGGTKIKRSDFNTR